MSIGYKGPVAKILLTERIAREREAQGVSQAELARRIGTHFTHMSRLERGRWKITTRALEKINDALGGVLDDALEERLKFDAMVEERECRFWVDPPQQRRKRA